MYTGLWQTIRCEDANAMIDWLLAIGFTEQAVYRREGDERIVDHAQMLWPEGGGLMLGSATEGGVWSSRPGTAATHLDTRDPDGVHAKAVAAGAESIEDPSDKDYGGRSGGVRDPEGNLWSFGYQDPA